MDNEESMANVDAKKAVADDMYAIGGFWNENEVDVIFRICKTEEISPASVLRRALQLYEMNLWEPQREKIAILRMLIRKATWLDRWRARKRPGHWLNQAWREIIIHDSQILSGPYPFADYPCRVKVKP